MSELFFLCLSCLSFCLPVCVYVCVCASMLTCRRVLLKGKKDGGCTMGTPGPDTSVTIRGSPLSFLFDFLLAMQSSPQRHRQEVLHHYMMDKWTGRLKTRGENVRIHSHNLFKALKIHTQTHRYGHTHTHTLRMLCFLPFATSESDIFYSCCVLF